MVVCHIAIGSNLGERRYYIDAAIKKVRMLTCTRVKKISQIIESLPAGGPPQGPYLNAVFEIETDLSPYQLLQELQKIESSLGRVRAVTNGPRTIDLDILTYGDICMNEDALCIPHPRILERDFVMVPLIQIAPEALARAQKQLKKTVSKKKKARKGKSKT